MAIIDWIGGLFTPKKNSIELQACYGEISSQLGYKMLAINSAINLISKTLALSSFETYNKGQEVKDERYYRYNISPNNFQTANEFWREVIYNMVFYNEVLIFKGEKGQLIVADSYTREQEAIDRYVYKDITRGNFKMDNIYTEEEVLYIQYENEKMMLMVDSVYKDYSTLIEASRKGYINNQYVKGVLDIDSTFSQSTDNLTEVASHYGENFKKFLSAEGPGIFPLQEGLEWRNINEDKGKGAVDKNSDTKKFVNDIFDYVAIALQIPPSLLKGDVIETGNLVNDFLTFCIKPLAKVLTDEINRKEYTRQEYTKRTYMKIDTTSIRVTDLKDIAYAIDVLTRTGANTIDDNLRALGREPVGGDIGGTRFMTKNYEPVTDMINNPDSN